MDTRRFGLAVLVGLLSFSPAEAAKVTFSVVATADPSSTEFIADPGIQVAYEIRGIVEPDDANNPDTAGLVGFSVDLETDFGVAQPQATAFGDEVQAALTFFPSLGTVQDDDLIGISAAQFTAMSTVSGVGFDTEIVIATGLLQLPNTEGTFTVSLGEGSNANVLQTGDSPGSFKADVTLAGGFTITTSLDGTGNGTPLNDAGAGADTTPSGDQTGPQPLDPVAMFLVLFGPSVILAAVVIAILLNGWF